MEPTFDQVLRAVRMAINSPSPVNRSEAAARLMLWDLPVSPGALQIAAERVRQGGEIALDLPDDEVGE
jgi:hypothetical protein